MVILKPNRTTQWIYKESTINNNPIEQPLLYIYIVILYRKGNIKQVRNYFLQQTAQQSNLFSSTLKYEQRD